MKTNNGKPSSVWLDEGLAAYHAPQPADKPPAMPPDFAAQCRAVATRVCDVSRMTSQRPQLRGIVATLHEHFESLARVAGVDLVAVLKLMGISQADGSDQRSTAGLARLAHYLGLDKQEAVFRMELAFAKTTPSKVRPALVEKLSPASGRGARSPAGEAEIAALVKRCEAEYPPAARQRLRRVIDTFDAIYENT